MNSLGGTQPTWPEYERVRFGSFVLDLRTRELATLTGDRVPLAPKPTMALVTLVRHAGSLVTREELQARIWPNTVIGFDQGLNTCIRNLRSVLNDQAESPGYIETIPRRGYRFLAPVVLANDAKAPRRPGTIFRRLAIASAAALVLLVSLELFAKTAKVDPVRVAVLPVEVIGGGAIDSLIALGLAEEMRGILGQSGSPRLQVLARTSSRRLESRYAPGRMRTDLGLDYIIESGLRQGASGATFTVSLVDMRTESAVWTGVRGTTGLGAEPMQKWIAQALVDSLGGYLGVSMSTAASLPQELQQGWLVARALVSNSEIQDSRRAVGLLDEVLAGAPEFVPASVLTARALVDLRRYAAADSILAAVLATRRSSGALVERGRLRLRQWRPEDAVRDLAEAAELDIGSARAHHYLAYGLGVLGKHAAALEHVALAIEIDPVSAAVVGDAGLFEFWAGQTEQSIARCRELYDFVLARHRGSVERCLLRGFIASERVDSAMVHAAELMRLAGESGLASELLRTSGSGSLNRYLVWAAAPETSHGSGPPPLYSRALYLASAGENQEAFALLQEALDEREPRLLEIDVDPRFTSLRALPRFAELQAAVRGPAKD